MLTVAEAWSILSLPVPAEIRSVRLGDDVVSYQTTMSVEEVSAFYSSVATEYGKQIVAETLMRENGMLDVRVFAR